MKRFRANVQDIDKMTEQFIKESFRKLRSAEGAFDLVDSFQNIGGGNSNGNTNDQQSIKQQISDRYRYRYRYKDILEQYIRELDAINQTFNIFKDHPPLYKNYPPVAGAIAWSRDLYLRAKRPILRFKKHELLSDDFGENVKERYLIFARAVDHYISDLYNDWEGNVAALAVEKLRQLVLKSIAPNIFYQQQSQQQQPSQNMIKNNINNINIFYHHHHIVLVFHMNYILV